MKKVTITITPRKAVESDQKVIFEVSVEDYHDPTKKASKQIPLTIKSNRDVNTPTPQPQPNTKASTNNEMLIRGLLVLILLLLYGLLPSFSGDSITEGSDRVVSLKIIFAFLFGGAFVVAFQKAFHK
jgi:hypothetical protein